MAARHSVVRPWGLLQWTVYPTGVCFLLEDESVNNARWYSEYSAEKLEDITRRAGSFKSFSVFCEMLKTGISAPNENVFADILTAHDLEVLRGLSGCSIRAGEFAQRRREVSKRGEKRYIILTYATKYDRIHYPIPLTFCESPTKEMLQSTIDRLSEKVQAPETVDEGIPNSEKQASELEEENRSLRDQLQRSRKWENSLHSKSEANDIEILRTKWMKQRSKLEERIRTLENSLSAAVPRRETELRSMRIRLENAEKEARIKDQKVEALEATLDSLRDSHQRLQIRRKQELGDARKELRRLRISNRQLRSRLRDSMPPLRPALHSHRRSGGMNPTDNDERFVNRSRTMEISKTSTDRGRRLSSDKSEKPRHHSRSSSRDSKTFIRFNPTSYQRAKEKRLQELKMKASYGSTSSFRGSHQNFSDSKRSGRSTSPKRTLNSSKGILSRVSGYESSGSERSRISKVSITSSKRSLGSKYSESSRSSVGDRSDFRIGKLTISRSPRRQERPKEDPAGEDSSFRKGQGLKSTDVLRSDVPADFEEDITMNCDRSKLSAPADWLRNEKKLYTKDVLGSSVSTLSSKNEKLPGIVSDELGHDSEDEDIDKRLENLQKFLRNEKLKVMR